MKRTTAERNRIVEPPGLETNNPDSVNASGHVARRRMVAGRASVVPSSRAVMGALLCMAAALLTFQAFQQANQPPRTRFAVATHELAPGEILGPEDYEFVAVDLPMAQRTQAIESDAKLDNTTVLGPVSKGELLQRGMLIKRSAPEQLISFEVDSSAALAGRLRPGNQIAIFASENSDPATLIAENILITRVDQIDETVGGKMVLTVALPNVTVRNAMASAIATSKFIIVDQGGELPPVRTPTTSTSTTASTPTGEPAANSSVART
jgi:hypothetical protein